MPIQYGEQLDRTFHALGDATRRAMLAIVASRGECSASELGKPFKIAQPSVSQHLRVLEQAGLLSRKIDGRVHRFRLVAQPLDEAEHWVARHRKLWRGSLKRLDAVIHDVE